MKKRWTKRRLISNGILVLLLTAPVVYGVTATEAPAGFDNQTNGFEAQAQMDADRAVFDEVEGISDGLGPLYNAQSCRECHQNPVSGTTSQVTEIRAGIASNNGTFTNPAGGSSLIHDRAIDPAIQMRLMGSFNVATFRTSLNIAGDGFVEALPDSAFTNNQSYQAQYGLQGTIIKVPVLEASAGTTRIARFGWKNQHASLLSFASDAYLNEMGITSPLQPNEDTDYGVSVTSYNTTNGVPAIQDPAVSGAPFGGDIKAFTNFMRSLKVPPRDTVLAATSDAQAGASLFTSIGCAICHTATLTTAPTGTSFNGGQFIVPAALGNMNIHPYSDFMLHDVGTGDGVVQNGGQSTANQMRTAPLWGLRTKTRMMHDGLSGTRTDAILRHTDQAEGVIENFIYGLTTTQQNQVITFLNSL